MSFEVVVLVLVSALLHAGWNIVLKIRGDRLLVMTLIANGAALIAICILVFMPMPPAAAWPYFAISLGLQTGYHLFLIQAYRYGDLGQVYPIARGTAPVLVLLPALLVAGEKLSLTGILGVLTIAGGIASLAFHGATSLRENYRSVLYALGTAAFIAAYTVVDALGARETGSPHVYTVWLFAISGFPLAALALARHRRKALIFARENWRVGLAGGTMSIGAYWLVVWALTIAPMAQVAALRETSVVFAAILAAVFLREGFGAKRVAASCAVAAGIVILRL
jgi:drug/metabolite transporter (DMT)-like permease